MLSEEWKQTTAAFSAFLDSLDKIRDSVKQKQTEFDDHCAVLNNKIEAAKAKSIASSENSQIVTLNIGGKKFQTSQETLLSAHESFFWCMLHSGDWKPDEEKGEYFIDRSPVVFPLILESLRQQDPVSTEHLSKFEMDMLEKDLDFYGLRDFFGKAVARNQVLAWSRHTSKVGGIRFTDNNQMTAVFKAGVKFNTSTHIVSTPLREMLKHTRNTSFRWKVTCTLLDLVSCNMYLGIMDGDLKRASWLCLNPEGQLGNTSLTVECEFNSNTNTVLMSSEHVMHNETIDLTERAIADPVCVVELEFGGTLTAEAKFQITALW
eukprot:TRINITY_DN68057_c1_g2_i1.p1 TRINITY_DN68057_c1_g2~~TRINITY_DN68057_c1_g2_i1.p1  ORF type:complete len:320 (-),score=12.86 TRINITY_DN68057_c1_g2_i1:173-1132(-)